jgi:predicted amidohydrolase
MRNLRLAISQIAPRLGDVKANLDIHRKGIEWAKKQKAHLVVFPELSLTGYLVRGMVGQIAMPADDPRLETLATAAGPMGVIAGFVEKAPDGQFFNSAIFLKDGAVARVQRKFFPPTYGMFDERRFFASGTRVEPVDTPWGRMGMQICFDALHPAVAYVHQQAGVRMLVTLSVVPARNVGPDGSMPGRDLFYLAHMTYSRLFGLLTVYVNRVGSEEGLSFWGGSRVVDPSGKVLTELPEYEEAHVICDIDIESIDRLRTAFPHLKESRPDVILQELWRLRMGDTPPRSGP